MRKVIAKTRYRSQITNLLNCGITTQKVENKRRCRTKEEACKTFAVV